MRTGLCTLLVVAALSAGCDGSRDKLLADLQSPRAEERALAVKKLAAQGKPEDLVLFTRAAKDLAPIVRGEAAVALGGSQDPRVVDLLGELLEDQDEDVQAKAAMALAEIKSDKSNGYLTLQYGRRSRSTRLAIVQALKAANVPGAMARVVAAEANGVWDRNLRALTEGSLPERVAAAEEIGKSGRVEAVNRLAALTKDSQVILAAAAVRGLGYAGDHRAVGPIALLLTENFPELREAACDALLRLQDPQALVPLATVATEKSSASPLATSAIIALQPSPDVDKALCQIALDGGASEALAAGREMRKRGGCPEAAVADRLAKAREPAAFLQALLTVEALGPTVKGVLPKVLPLLTSPDAQVRAHALGAVAAIGDSSATPAVQKVYEQELKAVSALRAKWITAELPKTYAPGFDPTVGASAQAEGADAAQRQKLSDLFGKLHALDEARAKSAGRPIVEPRPPAELVDDASEEQLRPLAAAIRALGALKAPGALEALTQHAKDSSAFIRVAAYEGLVQLSPEGLDAAKQGLFEADRDEVGAVARALVQQGEAGQAAVLEALPKRPGEKLKLLEALRVSGVPASAAPVLIPLVTEGGAEAGIAASLLGDIKATGATDALLKYLEDPNAVARRDVLLALGRIGDRKAADVIARDLYHDSPEVRAAAAEALASVGTVAQFESLDALKGDYYRRVRESADLALSKIGAPTAESHK